MDSLNGWQRIGVVLSALWFLLVTALFGAICGRALLETDFAALWRVETAAARTQGQSSPPASGESFKGFFNDAITAHDRARASSANPYDLPDLPSHGGARAAVGMFDDLIPSQQSRQQTGLAHAGGPWEDYAPQAKRSEPTRARNLFDDIPDIATGSVQSTAGAYGDLIPKKGMSLKELQETGFWYSVLTAIPIALLWALGFAIAWIVAGFRTSRRELPAPPQPRVEPEFSRRSDDMSTQRLD